MRPVIPDIGDAGCQRNQHTFRGPVDEHPDERHAVTLKLGAKGTSMMLTVLALKPVELDAIVGVTQIRSAAGVETPYTYERATHWRELLGRAIHRSESAILASTNALV